MSNDKSVAAANVLVVTCAASAGIHAALAPEHLAENSLLGAGFVASALCLLAAAAVFTRASAQRPPFAEAATVALLAALIAAYVISRTTGLPVGEGDVEAVDAVGLATQALQAAGIAAALVLTDPAGARAALARGKESTR